jgi:hypothetical protein
MKVTVYSHRHASFSRLSRHPAAGYILSRHSKERLVLECTNIAPQVSEVKVLTSPFILLLLNVRQRGEWQSRCGH